MSKAARLLNHWLVHRKVVLELANRTPDDLLAFKPWAGGMALGDLFLHIATAADMFVTATRDGRFPKPERRSATSMNEVREILQALTAKSAAQIEGLTDQQLAASITASFVDATQPGVGWMAVMIDHEIHHKGQLFTYLRTAGVQDLPFFVSRS